MFNILYNMGIIYERKKTKKIDDWDCFDCGLRVTDLEMQSFKHDYGCPKCGNTFGRFRAVQHDTKTLKLKPSSGQPQWKS